MKTQVESGPDPEQLRVAVWREISHRRALLDANECSLPDLAGVYFRRLVLGGGVLAVVIGFMIGLMHDQPTRQNGTATVLKLDVFHPEAGELPHAFLMVRR
jgi:hypothetical protein